MAFRQQFPGHGTGPWKTYNIYDNPEWKLAESMAVEFNDIAGINAVYYNQDSTVEADVLYGETQDKEYTEGKNTKIVFEVGEIPTTYSMFGMIATDQMVAHIPKATYRRDVSQTNPPKVGDVVVIPFYRDVPGITETTTQGRTFELIHVAEDQNIFQLQSLVYSLYMIPYRFSEESDSAADVSSDLSTESPSITAYGDNEWVEDASDEIDTYTDVDRSIYGK
jgi:hypothetical protein